MSAKMGIILVLALVEPAAVCISEGSVNCDGVLDINDALVILRYAADLPLGLPAGCGGIG